MPDGDVILRRANASDAPGILECRAAAFAPHRADYTPEAYFDTVLSPQTIRQRLASMQVFVAVTPGEHVVGTIACAVSNEDEGHLRGMAVLTEWQGRGIAEALLHIAETELEEHGCTHITLDTTGPLRRAIRFYEKNGYRRSGKVTDFFGMPLYEFVKSL